MSEQLTKLHERIAVLESKQQQLESRLRDVEEYTDKLSAAAENLVTLIQSKIG